MTRKTQCKYQRYIKAFADVGSKSIQIKSNLGNHLHGDADLVSIVEVAISIQLVRRAVFSKKQSILRRFQRSNRGTLLKLTKMVMLLWMNGQSACIVYQSLAAWSCNLELGQDMEWSLHQNVRSQILSQLELDFCMQFETLPYCMGLSFCPSHNQVTWKLSKVKINPTSFGATHIHITLCDDVSSTQVSTFWVEFLPL